MTFDPSRFVLLFRRDGFWTVTVLAILACSPASAKAAGTSFVDEFDAFDEQRWYVSDGWANGAHQNCEWSREQVAVAGGALQLTFEARRTDERAFACAEIQSRARYGHGTYEVRLRTPRGSGLNAAFFTYIGPPHQAEHDEIDFEFLLKDVSKVQTNVHVKGEGGNEALEPLPRRSNAALENYAFQWTPDAVRFYVAGEMVREITDPAKIPTDRTKIFASLWGTDTLWRWMGPFVSPHAPVTMEIDRIAFTALGEPCQFEGSVACGERP